ncbi:contractile injection system protein, VgrG/Pvc8 family [Sphingobium sp. AP49]|uniref:phage late control D family protein n=1 Tax=Sphingobium sp. AP49 TaxID=1144307 RepID=UPI00026ECECF|nr:contractile injection system protein, VgrG/Pvc8 family [Sphingobium sp. AP49]WHO39159.1 contractile injection system protein, VgrG/Pvc8 family [Sphingobium sp. AP49]
MAEADFLVTGRPRFTIDGTASDLLERTCFRLEVAETDQGLATLEAVFLNLDHPHPGEAVDFLHFDGRSIDLGRSIEISFTMSENPISIFKGFVMAIGGAFPEAREPELIIHAEDGLARARIRRRTRLFERSNDADIIGEVATETSWIPDNGIAGPAHIQHWQVNQSDLALMRERAAAADAILRLDDRDLIVAARDSFVAPPIAMSSYNELIRFTVMADLAHQRTAVHVHGWDVAQKEAIHESAGADIAQQVGDGTQGRTGPELLGQLWPDAAEDVHDAMPATPEEARSLAESRMKARARQFVRGRGVANGNPELRVGRRVELVELGPLFSGTYQLTAVRHVFDMVQGYRTHFEASRAMLGIPA